MDIEQRLKEHMAESGRLIDIKADDPTVIMNAGPPRSGNVVRALAALVIVAMAGAGFWMLSDDGGSTTEIAAGDIDDADDDQNDDDDAADGNGSAGDGSINPELDLVNITSDLSPGNGQATIEDGVYYILATAPGRVSLDWNRMGEEEFMRLTRANSFYVFQEDAGWSVSTIEDRFISDFDVKDGLLYVVSTGSFNGEQGSVGISADQGRSWTWNDVDGLGDASSATILANGDQPVIFTSRWGNPDYDQAIALAAEAGIEILPMTLYDVTGEGFTYVPVSDENRCDVVVGQYLPGMIEMSEAMADGEDFGMSEEEFAAMREEELGWLSQEVEAFGCELPDIADLDIDDMTPPPAPVTKTWEGLGITTPESWESWSAVFRFDGKNLDPLELPYGPDVQTSYASKSEGTLAVRVFDPLDFDRERQPEGETVYLTTDGVNWTEEFRPFPQNEGDEFEAMAWEGNDFVQPVAGDRAFRMHWDEAAFMEEPAPGEEWVEPQPQLQQRISGGEWQDVDLDQIIGERQRDGRTLWEVRGSSVGVFLVFGPNWSGGEPPEDQSMLTLYTRNGVDWRGLELPGQGLQIVNNDNEAMIFSTEWDHPDGQYSVTETYLVRPKG